MHITPRAALCTTIGVIGGTIAAALGGWDALLHALVGLMAADYITGLICAGVFHASMKTANGALESRTCIKGLFRKVGILLAVYVAVQLDSVTGTELIRGTVITAFIASEGISIVENLGLMGLPMPKVLTEALEVLRQKAEDN